MDSRSRRPDARTMVRRASRNLAGRRPRAGGAAPRRTAGARLAAWRAAWRNAAPRLERVVRFAALIAFLCGTASFAGSSAFDIQSVDVAGNRAVPASDIVAASGLETETSAFTVNAAGIRQRLRRDPRIEDATVAVVLPDRVRITVQERPPVAALRVPGGYVLVSADGVALTAANDPSTLPVLTVDRLDPSAVQTGARLPSADARLGADLAGSLPPALRPDVAALRVDGFGEVIVYTRDGIAVKAGGADGVRDRIARAGDVLVAVRARGMHVEYVDLRFPDSIIVKPVSPNPATLPPGVHPAARPKGARVP
jgi:cell division protein FtsQ